MGVFDVKKTFAIRIAALAALAVAAASAPASATVYDWSSDIPLYSGGSVLGSGTITAQNTISTGYNGAFTGNLVTAITGTYDNIAITGLLGVNTFAANDNLIKTSNGRVDSLGIAFSLASTPAGYSTNDIRIFGFANSYTDNGPTAFGSFTLTPVSSVAVPEPSSLLLLASGALGLLLVARRRRA